MAGIHDALWKMRCDYEKDKEMMKEIEAQHRYEEAQARIAEQEAKKKEEEETIWVDGVKYRKA